MDNDAYVTQLEAHIEKLNQVIDKLLRGITVEKSIVYYVIPKEEHVLSFDQAKMYYTSVQDVYCSLSHMANGCNTPTYVRSDTKYADEGLARFHRIVDIYSKDVITGETKKVTI